jgi:hypothetical protein
MSTPHSPESDLADAVCLTVDVDWACPEVLADLVGLLDERGLSATFFCTHPGIEVPGNERAIHPNFRHRGDTMRRLRRELGGDLDALGDSAVYEYVVRTTMAFCPEARGVRGHSLFYDSLLLPIYRAAGIEYDSTYLLPLVPNLSPFYKEYDILEIPIYFNDFFYIKVEGTDFSLAALGLDRPGLKVCLFHPNTVYLNAASMRQYEDSRSSYQDAEALRRCRNPRAGIRDLFLTLIDDLTKRRWPTLTLGQVNEMWRASGRSHFGPLAEDRRA